MQRDEDVKVGSAAGWLRGVIGKFGASPPDGRWLLLSGAPSTSQHLQRNQHHNSIRVVEVSENIILLVAYNSL
jgi:hypothetical protein